MDCIDSEDTNGSNWPAGQHADARSMTIVLTQHPPDLPWHWMGQNCQWPALSAHKETRVIKNIRKGVRALTKLSEATIEFQIEIFCDIEVIHLDDIQEDYIALSYSVGNPFADNYHAHPGSEDDNSETERDWEVYCNGGVVPITKNLFLFLVNNHTIGPLWIDALSIDQSNDAERSSQIDMMDQIYLYAEAVLVWLGPEDSSAAKAISLMQELHDIYTTIPFERRPKGTYFFQDPRLFQEIGRAPISIHHWMSVNDFFTRTWFRRAWVLQELALSKRLHFKCGELGVTWSVINAFVEWLHRLGWHEDLARLQLRKTAKTKHLGVSIMTDMFNISRASDEKFAGKNSLKRMCYILGANSSDRKPQAVLAVLTIAAKYRTATDPRDKIYAFLGLVKNSISNPGDDIQLPVPDYQKRIGDLYTETTYDFLRATLSMAMLSFADSSSETDQRMPDVPSWAVDFNNDELHPTLLIMDTHNASKGWPFQIPELILDRCLQIEGIKILNVQSYTSRLLPEIEKHHDVIKYLEFILSHLNQEAQNPEYDVVETFFELLTAKCNTEHWNDNSTHESPIVISLESARRSFQAWLVWHIALFSIHNDLPGPGISTSNSSLPALLASSPYFPTQEDIQETFEHIVEAVRSHYERSDESWNRQNLDQDYLEHVVQFENMVRHCTTRCLIAGVNEGGTVFGVGPAHVQSGDEVWILRGGRIPFLLRWSSEGQYRLIGEAYVMGYMQGEVFDDSSWEARVRSVVIS